jgi:hypothetical protein
MSWGYWGIVTGLLALLLVFFVSVNLLYSGSGKGNQAPDRSDGQTERSTPPSRLAA